MKRTILMTGTVLLLFNTLIGLIISVYPPFNCIMADLSIAISTALIYSAASSRLDDGYKIGLTWLFLFTGFARTICCIVLPQEADNNVPLIIAAGILLVEILLLTIPAALFSKE